MDQGNGICRADGRWLLVMVCADMRLIILAFAVNSILAFMLGWFAQGYTIYHGMMGNTAMVIGELK